MRDRRRAKRTSPAALDCFAAIERGPDSERMHFTWAVLFANTDENRTLVMRIFFRQKWCFLFAWSGIYVAVINVGQCWWHWLKTETVSGWGSLTSRLESKTFSIHFFSLLLSTSESTNKSGRLLSGQKTHHLKVNHSTIPRQLFMCVCWL